MKKVTTVIYTLLIAVFMPLSAEADTYMQTLVLEAEDGDRINGFLYQHKKVPKDAPVALLLHGLTGSSLHWLASGYPSYGGQLANMLVERGYRVVAVDARAHGTRKNSISPMKRVKAARAGDSVAYQAMIENTVRDYGLVIKKIQKSFPDARRVMAVGYSMGAQMSVLLAAQNQAISEIITMVPPAVANVPAVAPVKFASRVKVPWLLLTAENDQFSTPEQNAALLASAPEHIEHHSFASGHVLPVGYLNAIERWLDLTVQH